MNVRTESGSPSLPCRCAGVLAISIGTALLAGVAMLVPGAPVEALSTALATDGAPPPAATAASVHAGLDWQRVERAAEPAGSSVAAYDCPPAATAPASR